MKTKNQRIQETLQFTQTALVHKLKLWILNMKFVNMCLWFQPA